MNDRPGRIHIIAGRLRRSRLDVPVLPGLRPTPARVRETLFQWLTPTLAGVAALDLCAGTGALGIEAWSRGAASVQFVESNAALAKSLRENLTRLHLSSVMVANSTALSYLRGRARSFGLVFLDPPFALQLWTRLARQLEQGGWLTPQASIYVEYARGAVPDLPANWQVHHSASAGEVGFALYRRLGGFSLS